MENTTLFKMFDDETSEDGTELSEVSTHVVDIANSIQMYISDNNTVYVHSTEIARQLGSEHKTIIRSIESIRKNDVSGVTNRLFTQAPYKDSYGREQNGFNVTQAGFQMIALKKINGNPDILSAFAIKFNNYTNHVRVLLNNANKKIHELESQMQPPMSRDELISKGLIAANEVIQEQAALIAKQQAQITKAKDDIDFANAFRGAKNNMLVGQVAKKIAEELIAEGYKNNVGQNNLFEWLRKNGYLVRNRKSRDFNMPTKKSIDMGIMASKYTTIEHKTLPNESWNSGTPEITPKGVEYFRKKIKQLYYDGGSIV